MRKINRRNDPNFSIEASVENACQCFYHSSGKFSTQYSCVSCFACCHAEHFHQPLLRPRGVYDHVTVVPLTFEPPACLSFGSWGWEGDGSPWESHDLGCWFLEGRQHARLITRHRSILRKLCDVTSLPVNTITFS